MTAPVVVVGSINVDLTIQTKRLPGPGETVIGGTFALAHGGKGANQAVAVARLGVPVILLGMVGDDAFGEEARAELGREGVGVDLIRTEDGHTGTALILIDASGENLIAVASGVNERMTQAVVEESLTRIDANDAVVLAVLEVPDPAVQAASEVAKERGWRFVLNPAPARPLPADLLARCDVLTPNQHEIIGLGAPSAEALVKAGVSAVVVTMGSEGADVYRSGSSVHHQETFDVRVVDTTGAGDAFAGALAVGLVDGLDMEQAVERAAAAGALATRAVGARTAMPTRAEIDDLLGR